MLEGINKGKKIKQLQQEMLSVMDSYKEFKESGEVCACNFMEGFVMVTLKCNSYTLNIQLTLSRFPCLTTSLKHSTE